MSDRFTFADRVRKPWYKKINPIWWFQNDDEQTVDAASWYRPGWPHWLRWLVWNVLRNPLQNFRAFVIGVQDKNYTVTGRAPVLTVQRNDLTPPESGFQWCVCWTLIPRPFVSYSVGANAAVQIGWQPNGFFSLKIDI